MEIYKIRNVTFSYPMSNRAVLSNINLSVKKSEFITVCGKSGCGKTTLLRLLKPTLSPVGEFNGTIWFDGKTFSEIDVKTQVSKIGFVQQNPENQIITDKVWHELAFGLESLGFKTPEIRTRVAEMASFFGIQTWFNKETAELSGGQKQLLNLASVMVMQPTVVILDEPTSQLDPIAAHEFLTMLKRVNQELGTTVIMTEHRLEEAFPLSDRIIVIDDGKIISDTKPSETGRILKKQKHAMYNALPAQMRVCNELENVENCPVTVKDGRIWLEEFAAENGVSEVIYNEDNGDNNNENIIDIKNAWFRYDKNGQDIIKNLNMTVKTGEIYAIVGGNGTGKTTALSLVSGMNRPYIGKIAVGGNRLKKKKENTVAGIVSVLPQNPQVLFVKKTVEEDLVDILKSKNEKERIEDVIRLCNLENVRDMHPYDLSGGEQQRLALAKILLRETPVILMDEPTKGMDAEFKEQFGKILKHLSEKLITVVIVSHDIEFCAKYADRCAMFFDGSIISTGKPRSFFAEKAFYTTSANRIARDIIPGVVLVEDIISACGVKKQY